MGKKKLPRESYIIDDSFVANLSYGNDGEPAKKDVPTGKGKEEPSRGKPKTG